jgi:hypothetical protein
MALQVPSTVSFVSVDTATPKTIQLPLSIQRIGRVLTIKDRTGQANVNNITIQVQGSDVFQDGATSYRITVSFGSVTLVSRSGQWLIQQGTQDIKASTLTVQTLISTTALNASSVTANFFIGNGSLLTNIVAPGTVSTPNLLNLVSTANLINLVSTQNLLNLISSPNLISTTAGLERYISSFIDPQELASSIRPFISTPNLTNLVSTANLINLVSTANLSNLISSPNLISTTAGLEQYISSFIDPAELASSIRPFISTPNLTNLVSTANLINLVSTQNLLNLLSSPNLISTTAGLERYISSFVDPQELASSILPFISTPNLLNLVSTSFLDTQMASTVRGLGTAGYLSSFNAFSMSTGRINTSTLTFVDINTQNQQLLLVSSGTLTLNGQAIGGGAGGGSGLTISDYVVGGRLSADQTLTADVDNTIQFIDDFDPQNWYNPTTYFFTPTIAGYYLVTYQVWFSVPVTSNNQFNIQIQKNSGNSYTITQLAQNTVTGTSLNATKMIYMNGSTDNLRFNAYVGNTSNTTVKAQQGNGSGSGTFFTAALLTNGSGGENLISTVAGLGSIGYASTTFVTNAISSFSTAFGPGGVNMTMITSTVAGLGTAGYVSSASIRGVVSTPNLLNLVSTANLTNLVSTANLLNLVSSANLLNLVSTTYLDTQVASTVRGLGTAGYLSSVPGVVSTPNLLNLVSTQNLINLVSTPNLLNLISSPNLISTTAGLERYISSFIDPQELASSIRPFISVPNLTNLVSTANLINLVSTANLINMVSTSYLTSQLTSTVDGLGTIGYRSTLLSSFLTLSTGLLTTSTLTMFDSLNYNSANNVYVKSTFLYFNNYIVAGTTQLQPQIFTF